MSTLFKDGKPVDDVWIYVDGEQPVPEGADVVVPLDRFLSEHEVLSTRNNGRIGVHLEAGEQIDALQEHLDAVALISLDFPSYADGRAFSKARLLHDEWGYDGEVRAVGDVRIDQVAFMERCGFTTLRVDHQPTIDSLLRGHDPSIGHYYQPAAGSEEIGNAGRPWRRLRTA